MALYLKYRPKDFNSLVGQEFIKTTLKKAVAEDKTVGAYLFTGPRGTGKTSSARIFAKAINCENTSDGNPCGECSICKSFAENSLIDIIEIDAASHTGVDNIREIIEKAQFRPTSTKYKIYIIDEVHMLSKGAFNALLKILEEPPVHVKFILATTEIHKVPETILSRCQRYDFRNHTDENVKERLSYIAGEEGITIDQQSLDYIVKVAGGGLRNAISLFEQLIVDNTISYDAIVETLGIAKEDEIKGFAEKLLAKDGSLLDDFIAAKQSGKNLKNLFTDVLLYIQDDSVEKLKKGENLNNEVAIMENIHEVLLKTKNSFDESVTIQIGLLKILGTTPVASAPQVIDTPATQPKAVAKAQPQAAVAAPAPSPDDALISGAEDIFATPSDPFEATPAPSSAGSSSSSIDVSALIEHTKSSGGKAALTMSLKGSDFDLDGETLKVRTKTKISLATIGKPENKEFIIMGCGKMGITVTVVEVS